MKDSLTTLSFAVALGLVCSLLLALTNRFTTPYREANERAEQVRNFLSALQVPFEAGAGPQALVKIFERNIRVLESEELSLYQYVPDGRPGASVEAVAVLFSGSGLWGPIHAVMALEPDLVTIRAVRFYKQEETPGLGGEIGADWFQDQFKGKKMVSTAGEPVFRVRPGAAAGSANGVDAVTGATMTSERVEEMLNAVAVELQKERKKR